MKQPTLTRQEQHMWKAHPQSKQEPSADQPVSFLHLPSWKTPSVLGCIDAECLESRHQWAQGVNGKAEKLCVNTKRHRKGILATVSLLVLSLAVPVWGGEFSRGINDALGPRYKAVPPFHPVRKRPPRHEVGPLARLHHWNEIAINTSGLDHTPVATGEQRVFGEQYGPTRASRAMAIVHIAIFEAVNAIAGDYESYTGLPALPHRRFHGCRDCPGSARYAGRRSSPLRRRAATRSSPTTSARSRTAAPRRRGLSSGGRQPPRSSRSEQTMARSMPSRASASSSSPVTSPGSGAKIRSAEPDRARCLLGRRSSRLSMKSAKQFRVRRPPALKSPEYAAAFDEVKQLGGDGIVTPTVRTAEQTEIGDLSGPTTVRPSLCAPPRLYNQIAVQIAEQMGSDVVELARLLALVNVAMADAGIAIWESKYHYEYWRPVTGIREADAGTGPTGQRRRQSGDYRRSDLQPLGAPASNLNGPELHAAVSGLPVRARRLRRRALPDPAQLLSARTTSPSPSCRTSSTA